MCVCVFSYIVALHACLHCSLDSGSSYSQEKMSSFKCNIYLQRGEFYTSFHSIVAEEGPRTEAFY